MRTLIDIVAASVVGLMTLEITGSMWLALWSTVLTGVYSGYVYYCGFTDGEGK